MYQFIVFVGFILSAATAYCQLPSNLIGSNAPGLKWHQINTDKVKIIYPQHSDSTAQRIVNIIHYLWSQEDSSLGSSNLKTSIVLHSQAAVSNGFVTVGPFRSEFFPANGQFSNSTDYVDLLTIHEFRHISQFANATRGITKTVKNILGSWAWGGMMATALPRWYFEGDAVISETESTASGRGRLPAFNMQFNALFRSNTIYNYEKAGAGSLKDFVPDWYPLGYQILKYGKSEFGNDLWAGVVDDAVRYKGIFYPFSRSLKFKTGLSSKQMYRATFDNLKNQYDQKISSLDLNDYKYVGAENSKFVSDYTTPKIHNGDTLVIKSAYDQLASVIEISRDEKEYKLFEVGRQLEGIFGTLSVSGDHIVWAEFANDVRWRYRQYSDIYKFHIPDKIKTRLTAKARYSAPALSVNASKIAAIITHEDLSQGIHILSSNDGQVLSDIQNSNYSQLSFPCWISDEELVLVVTANEKSHLARININSGRWSNITPPMAHQLSHPFYHNESIYFSSAYSGINNIYNVRLLDKTIYKITEAAVGAYQPFVTEEGEWLLYSELTSNGMKIKRFKLDISSMVEYRPSDFSSWTNEKLEDSNHEVSSVLDNVGDTLFVVSKFNKWSGIFNFHSIIPQFNHPSASFSLLSDNVFGTLSGEVGAAFNYNEDEWSYFAGINYAELFPVLNLSYAHAQRSAQYFNFAPLTDTSAVFTAFNQSWSEDRISSGVTFPFNLSQGNTQARISLGINYQYAKLNLQSDIDSEMNFRDTLPAVSSVRSAYNQPIESTDISTLDLRFNSFAVKRQARLHLKPRLGATFSLRYRKQLLNNLEGGDVFNVRGSVFLPGVKSTHSFYITADFQKENVIDNYRYSDQFEYPRGYDISRRRDKFSKIGINYSFPLWYPDQAIGPLAFVKRIKANMFYDHAVLSLSSGPFDSSDQLKSTGIELGIDFRALRLVEVDIGVRYSFLLDPDQSINGNRHQLEFFVISITQ